MCAIAGVVNVPVEVSTLKKMLSTMERRGPDGHGSFKVDECALLHTRLAIIDPENGAQPMLLQWEREDYVIVYNGELYNTRQIRSELESLGHHFMGHSDTEVVLHAYAQWGSCCVERFNGIYALAVWERKSKRLFLARDRIGVKPLFYCLHHDGLIFGSEIKTILAVPSVPREIGVEEIAQLMMLGPGRIPGKTPFRGILEVEPGCAGYYEDGKLTLWRYWQLRDREHQEDFGETAERVRYLVKDAIKGQLVSDVDVGCFLSGGLDSSIICAISRGEKPELDTFSLDYQDNDRYFVSGKFQPDGDNRYIQLMREQLDCRHHWTVLSPESLLDYLEDSTIARDVPGMGDVDFSMLAFCGQIRKHVKVALSGECADEIFGGYPWFRDPQIRNQDGFPWSQNVNDRVQFLHPWVRQSLDGVSWVEEQYRDTVAQSDILPENSALERRMKEMVNLNFRWFMQTLLDRKDRMSMYHGLEVRVPFCDHRIAEYMYGVPWRFKDYQGREKGLLRYAMEGLLPREVLYRKKSPYPKTYHPQYREMVIGRLKDLLERKDALLFTVCDRAMLLSLLEGELKTPWYGQLMMTPQTCAYFLQLEFWLEHYKISIA